jgi:GTP-binding protein 1
MTIIQIFLGVLDDGRGRARVGLFRHKHEIETGRTSSVGMEVSITPDNYLFS